jgi:hypothetical protein
MSLQKQDLKYTMFDIFEVDSYSSKMGDDSDIVTVSFSLKEKAPAEDLVKFLESGYDYILDADVSAGEQSDNTYKVFVEIERNRHIVDNIHEILEGVKKLSGVENFKFRYYKNFKHKEATVENLQTIPTSADDYESNKNIVAMENYKNFFADSFIDSIDMLNETIILKKRYTENLRFKFIDFGNKQDVFDRLTESFNPWEFAEIIYLSKYIGDYNITKYGNKLTLENKGKTLVVERIS